MRGPLGTLLLSRGLINVGFFTLLGFLLFFVRDSLGIRGGEAVKTQTALLFISFTLAAIAGAIVAARPADRYDKRLVVSLRDRAHRAHLAAARRSAERSAGLRGGDFRRLGLGRFRYRRLGPRDSAVLPGASMATAMGIWNVATTVPQIVAPLLTAPLVERANASAPGLGPRLAILLAVLEFGLGGILIWRLPRALTARPSSKATTRSATACAASGRRKTRMLSRNCIAALGQGQDLEHRLR